MNAARREAERVMSRLALPKTGIISGYDPDNYAAKVRLQPQDVETGWLPIRTPWAGKNWGMFCPPNIGDEVEVQFQDGGKGAPYVALRAFGNLFRPLSVPAGEFWLVHGSGSFLKFLNDGSIEVLAATAITSSAPIWNHAGNVHVDGDVFVTGEITDQNGAHGTLGDLRSTYDTHTHPGIEPGGGDTQPPNQTI